MTQNPIPNDGIQRGSGRANPIEGLPSVLPFIGFLGFGYIALTMGSPDRMLWEQPATAIDRDPIPPMCVKPGISHPTGQDDWTPCK